MEEQKNSVPKTLIFLFIFMHTNGFRDSNETYGYLKQKEMIIIIIIIARSKT